MKNDKGYCRIDLSLQGRLAHAKGIARDLDIPSETVIQIIKDHREFFILPDDEPAKFAFLPSGFDAVSLTDRARNLYLQELTLSS